MCELSNAVVDIRFKRKHRFFLASKMLTFVPKKPHLREVLLHYYILKESAAETHRILVSIYGL